MVSPSRRCLRSWPCGCCRGFFPHPRLLPALRFTSTTHILEPKIQFQAGARVPFFPLFGRILLSARIPKQWDLCVVGEFCLFSHRMRALSAIPPPFPPGIELLQSPYVISGSLFARPSSFSGTAREHGRIPRRSFPTWGTFQARFITLICLSMFPPKWNRLPGYSGVLSVSDKCFQSLRGRKTQSRLNSRPSSRGDARSFPHDSCRAFFCTAIYCRSRADAAPTILLPL